MKTPMQELIDYAIEKYGSNSDVAMTLKKKEKQTIIDAASGEKYLTHDFVTRAIENDNTLAEQYYNETFKQQ